MGDSEEQPVLIPWIDPDPSSSGANQVKAAFADSYLNHLLEIDLDSESRPINLTSIMVTVGKRNKDIDLIIKMMKNGANIIRIPTHSSPKAQIEEILKAVKQAREEMSVAECFIYTCSVALETRGSQIRTGILSRPHSFDCGDTLKYSVNLKLGAPITLTNDFLFKEKSSVKRLYVDSEDFPKRVQIGDTIYIDGRNIQLEVQGKDYENVHCTVVRAGKLRDQQLITVPNVIFNIPILGEKDWTCVELAIKYDVDMIMVSCMRNVEPIRELKNKLEHRADRILIIAKIETLPALQSIDEIIEEADGIFLERGKLAAVTNLKKTFLAQKLIAAKCNNMRKPFLVGKNVFEDVCIDQLDDVDIATINDITSLVEIGTDVVVLGQSENAPNRIEILKSLLIASESLIWEKQLFNDLNNKARPPIDPACGIAISCVEVALKCQAAAIIIVTCSGYSAKLVSSFRPQCPILAVSSVGFVCKQLNLYKNVKTLHYIRHPHDDWSKDVDCRIQFGIQRGMAAGIIKPADPLVLISGWRRGAGFTNTMRVVYAPID